MKRLILSIISLTAAITIHAQTVRVAAASSLRYVLEDLKTEYARINPNVTIEVSLGSSGALAQQILNGASIDFFMAADNKFPQKLAESGYSIGYAKTYAYGRLVFWSTTMDVSKGIKIFTNAEVKKIAIAKPEIAPYGEKAVQLLKYYKIYDQVKPKLVYAENIAQAAQYAETGNADIAIIAYSLVLAPEITEKGNYFVVDTKSYKPVEQTCVLIKGKVPNAEAVKFMDFILSEKCKLVFEKYGFIVPEK